MASLRSASGYDEEYMAEHEKIPPEIQSNYHKALDSINMQHRNTVSNLLRWMTFGLRHLTEEELSCAIALAADPSVLGRRYLEGDLKHACFDVVGDGGIQAIIGTLLKATQTPSGATAFDLVHAVPQWLLDGMYSRSRAAPPSLLDEMYSSSRNAPPSFQAMRRSIHDPAYHIALAHEVFCNQCFSYLQGSVPSTSVINTPSHFDMIRSRVPFFSYAAENIFEHARLNPTHNARFFAEMAKTLDEPPGELIRDWFWHFKAALNEYRQQSLLQFACELGLEGLVSHLVPKVTQQFGEQNGASVLDTAAAAGVVPILKLLFAAHPRPADEAAGLYNVAIVELFEGYGYLDSETFLATLRHGSIRTMEFLAQLPSANLDWNSGGLLWATHTTVRMGAPPSVEWLNTHGHFNNFDWDGQQPIHIAAQEGHVQMLAYLLDKTSLKMDDTTKEGLTAICLACRRGHYGVVAAAVHRGATTRWEAAESVLRTALNDVIDAPDFSVSTLNNLVPEELARTQSATQPVGGMTLVDIFFGGIDAKDDQGRTLLHNLVLGGCRGTSNFAWTQGIVNLLDHGADSTIKDSSGKTILHSYIDSVLDHVAHKVIFPDITLTFGRDGLIKTLCSREPQLITVLDDRRSDLLSALNYEEGLKLYPNDAEYLLTRFPKTDLNAWLEHSATTSILLFLRARGRPDEESDGQEKVAVTELSLLGQSALACLREQEKDGTEATRAAVSGASYASMSPLGTIAVLKQLQTYSSPHEITYDDKTGLMLRAAETGNVDGLRYLIETCAMNIESTSPRPGRTPLLVAAKHGRLDAVEYLLGRGTNVNMLDWERKGALYLAAEVETSTWCIERHVIIQMLVEHGARITDSLFWPT
ncbi:hypothetical protein B0H66DRAFT_529080 [Apodospora peruviana]|uniref:Ankyrin n=1 Tax=Apodospora peruviana TaxID=516989 RepID=A0AAE0IH74_9PEZI|nr:hypothetical protein B0H66DRAFT_529080 [Apodospora peruviana]